ncbi:hypothetical protein CSIM01_07466 [Colletotrichum simmondsii]|uniref:Uncharacterized protein n=1 Tax=Colletotrichum simmondsii TaxID=703756 RepID=A0A135SNM1_9PEZI|nr:hypothetical protein CSIM01_07466 [Colletotrichum simmondsii]
MEQYGREPEPQRSPSTFIYNLAFRPKDQNSATSMNRMAVQASPMPPHFDSQLHAGSLLERRALAGRTIHGRPLAPLTVQIPHRNDMDISVTDFDVLFDGFLRFLTRHQSPKERHALAMRIRSVQDICLRASQKYHERRRRQARNDRRRERREERRDYSRGGCLRRFRGGSRRPSPYDRPVQRDSHHDSSSSASSTASDSVSNESLLHSIGRICNHLWEQANVDAVDEFLGRGKKREAAATMAQLLEWAETVVECSNRSKRSDSPDRSDLLRLLEAAKNMRGWLGDSDGEAELGEVEGAVTFYLTFGVA